MRQDTDSVDLLTILTELSKVIQLANFRGGDPTEITEHLAWAEETYGDKGYADRYIEWMKQLRQSEWRVNSARILANAILN